MSNCLSLLYDVENSMTFSSSATAALQAVSSQTSKQTEMTQGISQPSSGTTTTKAPPRPQFKHVTRAPRENSAITRWKGKKVEDESWKAFLRITPFLAMPAELHFKIMGYLHPIDATCLSLVNKYLYRLRSPSMAQYPLEIGSPFSVDPYEGAGNCKFCCPVNFQPAHCELHFHLRPFIPKSLKYCGARCQKYTKCEDKGYSDSHEHCGNCGVNYRRRYERGRRVLDQNRRGPNQHKLKKWYNDN